jgi:hypothetical protein
MIICPTCAHVNPEGATNCEECMTPLPIMIQCPQCGESVQDDAVFCGNCGYNLQQNKTSVEIPEIPVVIESEKTEQLEVNQWIQESEKPPLKIESEVQQEIKVEPISPTTFLHHVQTEQNLELPKDAKVVYLGRPNKETPPDIDVSALPNSDIVSRVHAHICLEDDGYYLEDMGSANGTYVNGQRLLQGDRYRLTPGDRFSLGKEDKVTFVFCVS